MLTRRGWLIPGVLSIATHVSVFTIMPSTAPSAAMNKSVPMRIQDPPPPPKKETPPAQVVVKKPDPPPPKKIVRIEKPKEPEPPPPVLAPPPKEVKPVENAPPPKTTDEVAAPGPAEPQNGTGPAAGNGAMLGESRPPTTNVAEGAPSTEKRDGAAVSAATRKRDLQGYHRGVFEAVNKVKRYPPAALRLGLEGKVRIVVAIDRQGRVLRKKIVESSGHELLDQRALQMIDEVAPFGPLPDTYDAKEVELTIPVSFRLTDG